MKAINQHRRIGRYASTLFFSSLLSFSMTQAQADLGTNLALDGGADGSSKAGGSSFGNVIDGDTGSYWQPESAGNERIGVKNVDATFNTVVIRELNDATTSWRLEDHETGEVFASGSSLGSEQLISGFGDQNLYKINLIIESASEAPQIAEFEVYSASGTGGSGSSESDASSSESATGTAQCNWYGTLYPLCDNQNDGWGWENSESCIGSTTCSDQPEPYGIVGDDESEASSSSSASEEASSSSSEESRQSSQVAESSSSSSEVATSSSSASSLNNNPGEVLSCEQANTIQGFATMGSGTTGGQGGQEITVSTGYEIEQALSDQKDSSTPLTIYVDGTISPSNSDVSKFDIKDMNDVSIIGVGDNALFDGIGIKIWRADNVIIRNVTMRYVDIGDKDHVTIEGPANNIWVDHNTFYNSMDVDKDYYDELVSGKGDVDNITVSYNVLRDSWKTSLWGSSDGDDDHRRVTFLGNHWENANSRLPLFRFGEAHVVNNYYDGVHSTGINSRMGAAVRIEGNVFENAHNPIVSYYSSDIGYWDVQDNIFGSNVTWEEDSGDGIVAGPQVESTISYTPPYGNNALPAADAQAHVLANAGAGIVTDCLGAPVSGGDGGDTSSSSSQDSSSSADNSSSEPGGEPGELGSNLALSGGADGSSKADGTSFGNVNDGDVSSYWQPGGASGERIGVKNFSGAFNTVIIRELNNATTAWRLEDHDTGEVLASGSTLGSERVISGFGDRDLYKVNLIIESASSAPRIGEFEVYNAEGEIDSGGESSSSSSSTSSAVGSSSSSSEGGSGGTVDPSLQGFATVYDYGRDTTTGGDGGEVVTVSNYADLAVAVSGDEPRVVQVSGTISADGDDMLRVGSHKTIVGLDNNATIDGFGFDISGWGEAERDAMGATCDAGEENAFTPTQNVIVQNLTFVNSSDDSINLQCFSHHVWINFNTFHSSNDGSVDIKRGSDLVTVSHNHFIDTDKTMLLGHSENNGDQDRGRLRVTYHHNHFDGTETRQPRVRFGYAHVFNNYYDASNYLLGLGIEATIYAEGNYVERTKTITEPFGSDYHVTWTDSNYYDEATIGRANDSSKTQEDWLDADNSVSPPSYQYNATGASAQPPVSGAGNRP